MFDFHSQKTRYRFYSVAGFSEAQKAPKHFGRCNGSYCASSGRRSQARFLRLCDFFSAGVVDVLR